MGTRTGNFSFFLGVSEPVSQKIGPKNVPDLVLEIFGTGKSIGIGII